MKKILVASILGMGLAATAFGQGVIGFANYTSTTYQQVMYANDAALGALSGTPVNSATVELQLFWALGNVSSESAATFYSTANAGITTFINPGFTYKGGGYYAGGNQILTGWNATTAPNVTFGVQAWETGGTHGGANYGSSALEGESALWVEGPGANANANGIQPSSNPAKSFNVGPPGMTIDLVPEPSIFALSGIGAAALALIRRKK